MTEYINEYCPNCGIKLNRINIVDATETKAKFLLIWCTNCKYVKEFDGVK